MRLNRRFSYKGGDIMKINRDKVTELLKNYPSYRYAIRMYESPHMIAAPIAVYDDMPRSVGYGSRAPSHNDGLCLQDIMDYQQYKSIVHAIEGALETLNEDERAVIELKWMRGITLRKIEERRHYGVDYAKKIHRRALEKMAICLRFVEVPEIDHIPVA